MENKTPTVQLVNISKSYFLADKTEVPILHDVSLEIQAGEMVALLGPSGSGKSTLMNIIGCLDVPTAGSYLFSGKEVAHLSTDELADIRAREISFVFQSFHLLPGKTVYQNVMLPLLYQSDYDGNRDAQTANALRTAQLEEMHWHKRPNQLSGGQRQRVAIARALVASPQLLLADEPTGNLDSKTGDNIIEALQFLNQEHGTTILIVTHDESLADVVNRVISIKDGYIVDGR